MTETEKRYALAAKAIGCPRDQWERFHQARISLQAQQLAASAAARLCDHPDGPTEILYGGARGGGKSHWGIAQVAADDCQRVPGLKFLYLRKVAKAGKEQVHDLRRDVLHSIAHEYKAQEGLIQFDNGSRIVLGHFQHEKDIDNYLGLQYDGALIEESTQLSTRKLQDIGTCVRTNKPPEVWRPRKYHTANPGGVGHAHHKAKFVEPHRKGTETTTRFIPATVRDNVFVNPEYRGTLEALTSWQRKAWLDGDWDIAAGQFFTTWRRERHVVRNFELPQHWRVWLGFDYGFTHYTSCHLMAEDGDGNVYAVDEHCERRWLPERHAAAIQAMCERHGVKAERIEVIAAGHDVFSKDSGGATIAEDYANLGLTMTRAKIDRVNGAAEILRRLGDVDAGIRPRVFIDERCARLIECLPSLEHDEHRPEDVLKTDADENGLGGDDAYDSFRYACIHAAQPQSTWGADPHGDTRW